MRKTFKYPISPDEGVHTTELPVGAEIVALRVQDIPQEHQHRSGVGVGVQTTERLFFWAIVDPAAAAAAAEKRRLLCVGTGWELRPGAEHIDTRVTSGGYVWRPLEIPGGVK